MVNRFSRLGETAVQYGERRDGELKLVYERKVVKKMLLWLGLDKADLGVKRPGKLEDDSSFLTLGWLASEYPSFPMLLLTEADWIPSLAHFGSPGKRTNNFWRRWEWITEGLPKSKPIGCVFPLVENMPGMEVWIVHNFLELPAEGCDPGDRHMFSYCDGLMLEQLVRFTNRLKKVWEPT